MFVDNSVGGMQTQARHSVDPLILSRLTPVSGATPARKSLRSFVLVRAVYQVSGSLLGGNALLLSDVDWSLLACPGPLGVGGATQTAYRTGG